MLDKWVNRIKRGIKKPPDVILLKFKNEIIIELNRFLDPIYAKTFKKQSLLKATQFDSLEALWDHLIKSPSPAFTSLNRQSDYEKIDSEDKDKIINKANLAVSHKVNLLGSGLINLGEKINWYKDYKTGISWQPAYIRDIQYSTPNNPSDVKIPWEISRLHWLIPVGQAYILKRDEHYAIAAKNILDSWITDNPYGYSINWTCTMEVALRILTWIYFFHIFAHSDSWQDSDFREKFLCTLFLHGRFITQHLEYSDINGNHYTANATGLVFAGLFFGKGNKPQFWHKRGWHILKTELYRQVFPDGVNCEASVAYHRLVLELFFLPAYYREKCGLETPPSYRKRLIAMANFAASYSRPQGTIPLWGDADDARALPLGTQALNDHRYLAGLIGIAWNDPELCQAFAGTRSEIFWLLGPEIAASLPQTEIPYNLPKSTAFPEGGFFIMRNPQDHIFIDCGSVGLGGRGGHGHNDCLAFEAVLNSVQLISDCGAYLYTASYTERNNFRSTAYHNTPQVDGKEINRFIHPDYLWNLHNDAKPELKYWETNDEQDCFCGSHSGYQRLKDSVTPIRTIILDHRHHALIIQDQFEGRGEHQLSIPLHLALDVVVEQNSNNILYLKAQEQSFAIFWDNPDQWILNICKSRVSPSYGVVHSTHRLVWKYKGSLKTKLILCIVPMPHSFANPINWALVTIKKHRVPSLSQKNL
jgi:uncharacterized heparinase superfamily protein